jgi:hypothetical protein
VDRRQDVAYRILSVGAPSLRADSLGAQPGEVIWEPTGGASHTVELGGGTLDVTIGTEIPVWHAGAKHAF